MIKLVEINEMIAAGMNRKRIAEKLKMNPETFGRKFKNAVGITFTRYKKNIIELLKNGTY